MNDKRYSNDYKNKHNTTQFTTNSSDRSDHERRVDDGKKDSGMDNEKPETETK